MVPVIGTSSSWYMSRETTAVVAYGVHLTLHVIYRVQNAVGAGTVTVESTIADVRMTICVIVWIRVVGMTAPLHRPTLSVILLGCNGSACRLLLTCILGCNGSAADAWLGGVPPAARPPGAARPAFIEDGEVTERPLLRYPLRRCIVELMLGFEVRQGLLWWHIHGRDAKMTGGMSKVQIPCVRKLTGTCIRTYL